MEFSREMRASVRLDAIEALSGSSIGLLATYASNARARRAHEKAGFVLEGVLRESDWVDGWWAAVHRQCGVRSAAPAP